MAYAEGDYLARRQRRLWYPLVIIQEAALSRKYGGPNVDGEFHVAEHTSEELNMQRTDPEFYERQAAIMLERAEILRSVPMTDPFQDEALITFTKVIRGQSYLYAAIKAGGSWHCTGGEGGNAFRYGTWQGLIDYIGIGALPTIFVLTDGQPLKKWIEKNVTVKPLEDAKSA